MVRAGVRSRPAVAAGEAIAVSAVALRPRAALRRGRRGIVVLASLPVLATAALAQVPPGQPSAGPPPLQGSLSLDLDIIAKELDVARNQIQPSLGASTYKFTRPAIENQPQGDNQPFNQVLLQAPGVAQD